MLVALFCMSGFMSTAQAIAINIEIGDQPYYIHGPRYWTGSAWWCWVPGHWAVRHHHKVWVHGHYRPC